jgi:very-short-patch-repair endonuclease
MKEQKVIKLYEQGRSTYQIAEHFNTYPNKIRRILTKNGVELKTRSQAQKNALDSGRATHPTSGKKRTKAERLKISSSVQEYWSSMDEDLYKERCLEAKRRWHEMPQIERDRICSLAIEAVQRAGKEGSKLEKFVSKSLSEYGHSVEFHKKNLIPTQKLEIDLYIPSHKTIIEIDGPSHFFPIWGEEKLQKQIIADNQKSGLILSKGYIIIRVKNLSDFVSLNKKEALINNLLERLQKIDNKFPPKSKRFIEIEL